MAAQIKAGSLHGDVFISADPRVNADLTGGANGDRVKWYVTFAESPLVLGISPSSRFADEAKGKPWSEVLMQPGVRIGRTDPAKDPKGALTVELLKKTDKPELAKSVLEHSAVLPEEALVKKVQTGELDVGFFYSVETTDAELTTIDLPPGISPKAIYTLTILQNAPNPDGAQQFISFLLGSKGSALLKEHGLALNSSTADQPRYVSAASHPFIAGKVKNNPCQKRSRSDRIWPGAPSSRGDQMNLHLTELQRSARPRSPFSLAIAGKIVTPVICRHIMARIPR